MLHKGDGRRVKKQMWALDGKFPQEPRHWVPLGCVLGRSRPHTCLFSGGCPSRQPVNLTRTGTFMLFCLLDDIRRAIHSESTLGAQQMFTEE